MCVWGGGIGLPVSPLNILYRLGIHACPMLCTQGSGSPFYFREDKAKKRWAIYTLLDETTEAYLQPASDDKEYRLTVMVGPPKYIFKFHRMKKSVQLPAATTTPARL